MDLNHTTTTPINNSDKTDKTGESVGTLRKDRVHEARQAHACLLELQVHDRSRAIKVRLTQIEIRANVRVVGVNVRVLTGTDVADNTHKGENATRQCEASEAQPQGTGQWGGGDCTRREGPSLGPRWRRRH